jgi:outer membrane biosynthesis protein TonB
MKKISALIVGLLVSVSGYSQQTPAPAIPYAPKSEVDAAKDKALKEMAKEAAREALKEEAAKKAVAAVATTTTTTTSVKAADECPPPVTPSKKKPDCVKPKKKTTPKPKPTPKPAQEAKKCPEQRVCPKCEPEVRTVEKEKTVYRDRTVTIDSAPKNTLNVLVGVGPHGLVTDYYETKDRQDEYAVRKEKDQPKGLVGGLQYQYRLSPSYSVGGLIMTNETGLLSAGYSW